MFNDGGGLDLARIRNLRPKQPQPKPTPTLCAPETPADHRALNPLPQELAQVLAQWIGEVRSSIQPLVEGGCSRGGSCGLR